jgi:hypothetical protein
MSSQHKHPPISFRPPEADRARLLQHAADTGEKVNAILTKALAEYLNRLSASR